MITPYILGSGMAGKAIAESFALLNIVDKNLEIAPATFLPRDVVLAELTIDPETVLCIANPSGLHTPRLLEAEEAGFKLIICEKPSSIHRKQQTDLIDIKAKVAILHVYRQMWGIQWLRQQIEQGAFGEVIAIDGRLWQSSYVAKYSKYTPAPATPREWVQDPTLTGEYGVSLGLGTHWLSIAGFLVGKPLTLNHHTTKTAHSHKDEETYINLQLSTNNGTHISGSISNLVHGATNNLEIHIIGEKASAYWTFMQPDEVVWGIGKGREVIYRQEKHLGSTHAPFHALGWLEGYIEILRQSCLDLLGMEHRPYPTLQESMQILDLLFATRPEIDNIS